MKTVLCYGDSNTWGFNPTTQNRFSSRERWTGALTEALGNEYRVVEEGLNGRTTVWDDPIEGYKNGKEYLIPCLESHKPIDLVAILLGTNDLKIRFSVSAYDIANSAGVLVNIVQKSASGPDNSAPQVLLMSPPVIGKLKEFAEMFKDARPKSKDLAKFYRRVAEQYNCHFLDASKIVVASDLDGIHWDARQHGKLGKAVATAIRVVFK